MTTDLMPILEPIRLNAKFEAVLVTDSTANVISAAYAEGVPLETLDALLALASRAAARQTDLQTLIDAKETIFFDWEGRQVICRLFQAGKQPYLMVVLAARGKAYKQTVGKLIKAAQKALQPKKEKSQDKPAKRRSR